MLAPAIQFSVCMDNGGEFLLREFAIFFYIANSRNIILRTIFIARSRNYSYLLLSGTSTVHAHPLSMLIKRILVA